MATHSWVKHFYLKNAADADVVAARFVELRRHHRRALTSDDVVADAKTKSSLLHPFFEWDDAVAAHKYRRFQATRLAGALQRAETNNRGREISVRSFVSVRNREVAASEERNAPRLIVPSDVAMSDYDMRQEILQRAMRQAERFSTSWQHLREFARIHEAIETTKREITQPRKRKRAAA